MDLTPDIVMYSTAYCPFCMRARGLLERKGVAFTEIDVGRDRELRAKMQERSGRRTVPQIFIGETHVGGSDDLDALELAGELDGLLGLKSGSG